MKNTLIVVQCCKKKGDIDLIPYEKFDMEEKIPQTISILHEAINKFSQEGFIDTSSKPITALSRYHGHFYTVPGLKNRIYDEIKNGSTQFLIMSAGYGLVHPFQKIHRYELKMSGSITRYWLNIGLQNVLEEFIENGKYTRVYGFFSKTAGYKKIFNAVNWSRLKNVEEAGYFYLDEIRGASKILKTLAKLMLKLLDDDFSKTPVFFNDAKVIFIER